MKLYPIYPLHGRIEKNPIVLMCREETAHSPPTEEN